MATPRHTRFNPWLFWPACRLITAANLISYTSMCSTGQGYTDPDTQLLWWWLSDTAFIYEALPFRDFAAPPPRSVTWKPSHSTVRARKSLANATDTERVGSGPKVAPCMPEGCVHIQVCGRKNTRRCPKQSKEGCRCSQFNRQSIKGFHPSLQFNDHRVKGTYNTRMHAMRA